jgi:hypothetical protein
LETWPKTEGTKTKAARNCPFMNSASVLWCRIWRHADPDTGCVAKKYCCEENTCSLCFCTNTPDVILEILGMPTVQKAPNVLRVFFYTCLINIRFLNIHVYWRVATQSCVNNIFVYLWEECLLATCLLKCVWQL